MNYDEDYNDPRQRCRHGSFIGSWWGPDYMCGWCESGEEPPTDAQLADMRVRRMLKIEGEFDTTVETIQRLTAEHALNFGVMANALAEMAETPYFSTAQGLYR